MRNFRLSILLAVSAAAILAFSQSDSKAKPDAKQSQAGPTKPAGSAPSEAKPTAAEPTKADSQVAEQMYKNIQSLKGTPGDQLMPTMQYFSASLGVQCSYCHVTKPAWAPDSDDKEEKRTARMMIDMTQGINQANFKGRPTIGCATCHAGHSNPNPVPPVTVATGQMPAANSPDELRLPTPSADQVLASYYTAIGGKDALAKLTTKVTKGSATTPQGHPHFELDQKSPNLYRMSFTNADLGKDTAATNGETPQVHPGAEVYAEAFNGSEAWRKSGEGATELEGPDLALSRLQGRLFDPELTPAAKAIGNRVSTDTINGHDCYVLRENSPEPNFAERLYFDQKSGLLVRRTLLQRTQFGPLPITWDYDDYRDVHGVKVPFKMTHITWFDSITFNADSVEFNTALEDTKFQKPEGK
ncbi:MAG TPA: c-type cytochrome [Terriglobales bacterium]|jgi:hypothetical protein|nr:c-type cytochrome [Terriglobales bacterium]